MEKTKKKKVAPKKHPGGRPSKYNPKYCSMLVDHMKQGFSFDSFGAIVDCAEDTLYEWKKVHPEFSDSYKKGRTYSRLFWEEMGIIGATEGNHFNATSWIFNMKNRFSWKDKSEVDVTSQGKVVAGFQMLPPQKERK